MMMRMKTNILMFTGKSSEDELANEKGVSSMGDYCFILVQQKIPAVYNMSSGEPAARRPRRS
jgi:hypothetical protein